MSERNAKSDGEEAELTRRDTLAAGASMPLAFWDDWSIFADEEETEYDILRVLNAESPVSEGITQLDFGNNLSVEQTAEDGVRIDAAASGSGATKLDDLDNVDVTGWLEGTIADRPASGDLPAGVRYEATDQDITYRNTSSNGWVATGGTGTESNPIPEQHIQSANIGEMSGVCTFISPSDSMADVNNAVSSPGVVVFENGNHTLNDWVDISSSNVTVIIQSGAHIKIKDSTTPSTISDNNSNTHTPVFFASGVSDITIVNRGTIDGNNANHERGQPIHWNSVSNGHIRSEGGNMVDLHQGVWLVDCDDCTTDYLYSDDYGTGGGTHLLAFEGCTGCEFNNTIGLGGDEVVDSQGINEGCAVNGALGINLASGMEVADFGGDKDCEYNNIRGVGVDQIVTVKGSADKSFTSKTAFSPPERVTIDGVYGSCSENAIVGANSSAPVHDLTVTNINVESAVSNDAAVIFLARTSNGWDGLTIEGKVKATGTSSRAVFVNGDNSNNYHCDGLTVDLDVTASDHSGFKAINFSNIHGSIRAEDCGFAGTVLQVNGSTNASNANLEILSENNSDNGVYVLGDQTNGGTYVDGFFHGTAVGNGGVDVKFRMEVEDCRWEGQANTLDTTGVRTVINGLGYNSGDPTSTGDWYQNGEEGIQVRDTSNNNTYLYNNGTWSQIASA
ncbi:MULTISPECIES: hypothetical protein [Halobacteriales]|uniref:Uncharacterized protein n=2 Tax=Halobacteriales TaxID=2235 RepID=A0A1I0QYC8_9EURY|nr:hypothetical protein [Natrinema salifodinae]SEW32871.1 hypothetical protein SAMN05216285_4161 [Natrinema salifodinae]